MDPKYVLYIALPILFLLLSALGFLFTFGRMAFMKICKRKPDRHTCFENTFSQTKVDCVSKERILKDFAWFDENKNEDVQITSFDGLKLFATVFRA